MIEDAVSAVLRQYPMPPIDHMRPLGSAGGFSGAQLWRLTIGPAEFCLRKWPPGSVPRRIEAIHRVLNFAASRGIDFLPLPLRTSANTTVCMLQGYHWSLSPWMPGEPAATPPQAGELQAALAALARFHLAVRDYPGDDEFASASTGPPPGLILRRNDLLALEVELLERAPLSPAWQDLKSRRDVVLSLLSDNLIRQRIQALSRSEDLPHVPLQMCLRDIWSAHVLFEDGRVGGLIDFDAMRVDSIAVDVSRLLGSYVPDDAIRWEEGLAGYHQVRPLSDQERTLVTLYDECAVILTPLKWLQWILLESRQFEPRQVLARLDATIPRLEHLRDHLRTAPRGGNIAVDP